MHLKEFALKHIILVHCFIIAADFFFWFFRSFCSLFVGIKFPKQIGFETETKKKNNKAREFNMYAAPRAPHTLPIAPVPDRTRGGLALE